MLNYSSRNFHLAFQIAFFEGEEDIDKIINISKISSSEVVNLSKISGSTNNVSFKIGNIDDGISEKEIDSVVLDVPEPWHSVSHVYQSLKSGGMFVSFLPTIMQVSDLVQALKEEGKFALIHTKEILERPWEIGGRTIRPSHRMVGHTGFVTMGRKCQPRARRG